MFFNFIILFIGDFMNSSVGIRIVVVVVAVVVVGAAAVAV